MPLRAEQQKSEMIEQVAGFVGERLAKGKTADVERFVRQFYRHVPPEDIVAFQLDDLYGAGLSLWNFGGTRHPGQSKVRAYNPRYDEHGWHTSHTVVEVINDDMPFLVDSVTAALNDLGLTVHLVIHPVLHVVRDDAGKALQVADGDGAGPAESYMHLQVDEQGTAAALRAVEAKVADVLDDVGAAVTDFPTMRQRLAEVIAEAETAVRPADKEERAEILAFLRWLDEDHFTFLGYREYRFEGDAQATSIEVPRETGLGILRGPETFLFGGLHRDYQNLPAALQEAMREPDLLVVTKANKMSPVHRPVPLDTIIVKHIDCDVTVQREHVFVGLFTSRAYNATPRQIPYLRKKVQRTLQRADFENVGHNSKALTHILETYPRDELYQISDDDLFEITLGILHLQERQRTSLFVRRDPFERFMSCLVFLPRDRYNTVLRERIQKILERAFNGQLTAFYALVSDGVHARIHFLIGTTPGLIPQHETRDVEDQIVNAARDWSDHLHTALIEAKGEVSGLALFRRYRQAFPTAYREATIAPAAVFDIDKIEEVVASGRIGLNLYRPIEEQEHQVRFKLYHKGGPVMLSDVLPMLEHMGLRVVAENPTEVRPADIEDAVWIHDFAAISRDGSPIPVGTVRQSFQTGFDNVWYGEVEDDAFNGLILGAGLSCAEVVILRAYAKYLLQCQVQVSRATLEATLAAYPQVARLIVRLFQAMFDPSVGAGRDSRVGGIRVELDHLLDAVDSLADDRNLRRFINLVGATLRTNLYQQGPDGRPKGYLSLKLDSARIEDLPLPRPWREIFVYSPRLEAVHLRGGRVARGGIRWSDRPEDFRTEVLGLMKAQMVKNGVIVPVGSKGGFVLKRAPRSGGREAMQAEAVACYQIMKRGLLDLTDNLIGTGVQPPADVIRRDDDDPYLVVAADKGTATFSDIANAISADYGFWLGDAFASGGSAGYDHKKMAITARGAWESVKRHFRELGHDTQTQPFTVIGVGDMSGDVFGNGMLLSEQIRLVAAFNHLHIFIDPDPDPVAGFAERKRLFELGRGSWDQYDAALISDGGGVFERTAKSIATTPQIRAALGTERTVMTPGELIAAMLRASVDLLWFGGIGTYVKGDDEGHAEVGDKANDALRINGSQLGARVVGEGANLGLTQRGRIDAARAGCRLNTDFIDNSAGVDCSDHEVNIKILLGSVVDAGDMTVKQRNQLLEEMTEEVAALVLRDNYLQTQALSLAMAEAGELLDQQAGFMRALEKAGRLNRAIEFLPDDEELTERLGRREGLTRPEQAVVLSYGKITLYDTLLAGNLPDDPAMEQDLHLYFPSRLHEQFRAAIGRHPLRREIIATSITNSMINRVGPTFVAEMSDRTGMGASDVARAYLIVRDSFDLRTLWSRIEGLDTQVAAAVQTHMLILTRRLVDRATAWVLRYCSDRLDIGHQVARLKPGVDILIAELDDILYDDARKVLDKRVRNLTKSGVPHELAHRVSALNVLAAAFDLIRISDTCSVSVAEVAPAYFDIGRRLGLAFLRDSATRMPASSHWQKQAVAAIIDDLYALQSDLTVRAVQSAEADTACTAAAEAWIQRRSQPVERIDQLIAELKAMNHVDIAMLAVANRRLRGLMAG